MDCIWVNLKNVGPPFFKLTVCQFIHVSKCHLLSWKIILSCYVAIIFTNERLLVCQFETNVTKTLFTHSKFVSN